MVVPVYLCHPCVILMKYSAMEQHGGTVKEKLERQVAELERKVEEQESPKDTAAEVRSSKMT